MLLLSIQLLLWLFLLLPGSTASTNSTIDALTGPPQPTTHSPEMKNDSSESALKPTPPTSPSLTSVGQSATTKPSTTTSTPTTLPASTVQDDNSSGNRSTAATSPPQDQEPTRRERTTTPATQSVSSSQRGTSKPATLTLNSTESTPTDGESPLTVAAFGVISFIVILVVVVIILVSVVSLRFKCNRSKEEDKQKPGSSMVSESCSADTSQKDNSITLISMKNINMNNSMSYPPSEKVL